GYINRTPKGRVATRLAYSHFGFPSKTTENAAQQKLF
ncbi:MAG TPA: Holliday junction branch migration DNA helicase RuvB, partial [Desulfobacteraceae bacterium]|nr:Holliday junction branch migration DNA helicase RuvB [Desulfobacteraceae bacterium]